MSRKLPAPLALAGVLGVAALAFIWRLGSSSLFIDEAFSWRAAAASFAGVFSRVHATEVAPPGYYVLLHFWVRIVGSDSEWVIRLLSVVAGIALVAAIWWLARLLAGDAAAVLAALMAALSPLVIEYAQQVRAYVFVMLFATIAVAAAIQASRRPGEARRWIAVAAAASMVTIWVHYTGLLVILPVIAYIWTAGGLTTTVRRAYVGTCAVALVIVAPLMVTQLRAGHQGGVAPFAMPTATNFARVLGTPFDGRFPPQALSYVTGCIAVAAALLCLALRPPPGKSTRERWLVVAAALTPVVAIAGVTVAAKLIDQPTYYSLLSRYTAVASPFMLVAIASAVVKLRWPAAVALVAVTAVSIISGLSPTYSSANFQPDLHAAFARAGRDYRTGDTIVLTGNAATSPNTDYYLATQLRRVPLGAVTRADTAHLTLPASGSRLLIVSDSGSAPAIAAAMAQSGWRAIAEVVFNPGIELRTATR